MDPRWKTFPRWDRSIWRGNTIQRDFPSRRCVEPLRALVRFYEPLCPRARAGPPDVSQREPAATFESKRGYKFGLCPAACGPTWPECSVRTAFEHQGCHCVPKNVTRTGLGNFGCPYVVTYYPTFLLKAVNPVPPFAEPAKGGARKG